MHKKELVMILVLGVLFSLSGVFAGHFVEINGTVYYRVANTSTLSSYENNGNVTNGTIDLTNNIGGVLSDSLLQNVSPIVYLFPIENSASLTRTIYYNVSDDSEIANCTFYFNSLDYTNQSIINESANNNFTNSNLSYSTTYNVSVYCTDEWGNIGNSSNVTFSVGAEPVVETPSSGGGGGILYNVDSGVNNGRFTKNIDVSVKINGTIHKLKVLNLTNSSVFFVLRSEPQNVSLNLNESKIVKVDSVNVKITLTKILGNVAYMNISKVVENMNEGESEVIIETPEVVDDKESELCFGEGLKEFCINYKTWGAILLIIVLVVIVVGLATKHHKVKKKRKLHMQNNLHLKKK